MAQCSASELIAEACQSGFTCRNEPELLALLNQLLCNYSEIASGFESSPITLDTSLGGAVVYSAAHGLPSSPSRFGAHLLCVANDADWGFLAGDRIDIHSLTNVQSFNSSVFADATNVYLSIAHPFDDGDTNWFCVPRAGAAYVEMPSSFNNFRLVFTASL